MAISETMRIFTILRATKISLYIQVKKNRALLYDTTKNPIDR